jgi:hypothetical protein
MPYTDPACEPDWCGKCCDLATRWDVDPLVACTNVGMHDLCRALSMSCQLHGLYGAAVQNIKVHMHVSPQQPS